MSTTTMTEALARRKVGILGGMGPMATQAFYRELIIHTRAAADQDHLEVVIESDPRIPDRTGFLLGRGPDPWPALSAAATRLKVAGAEVMVMPCNTAQTFQPRLEALVDVPFVPWVDSAVEAVAAVDRLPVAVLATRGTLEADIYGAVLRRRSMAYLLPTEEETDVLMDSIYAFKASNQATKSSQTSLVEVADALRSRGARSFILGCTELPLVLGRSSSRWPGPAIDPAVAVARRTVLAAGGEVAAP